MDNDHNDLWGLFGNRENRGLIIFSMVLRLLVLLLLLYFLMAHEENERRIKDGFKLMMGKAVGVPGYGTSQLFNDSSIQDKFIHHVRQF